MVADEAVIVTFELAVVVKLADGDASEFPTPIPGTSTAAPTSPIITYIHATQVGIVSGSSAMFVHIHLEHLHFYSNCNSSDAFSFCYDCWSAQFLLVLLVLLYYIL